MQSGRLTQMLKILVTGGGGLLAHALRELQPMDCDLIFLSHSDFDLTAPGHIEEQLATIGPQAVINTAAYNQVDRCETERDLSWAVNAAGPQRLAELCAQAGIRLECESTFASGLTGPVNLAFNSGGNLFEADYNSGNIYEFTPGGVRSTFASGLNGPDGLAFDSAGNLFVGAQLSGNIIEIAPGGVQSVFASGLNPNGLAFNSAGDLFEANAYTRQHL